MNTNIAWSICSLVLLLLSLYCVWHASASAKGLAHHHALRVVERSRSLQQPPPPPGEDFSTVWWIVQPVERTISIWYGATEHLQGEREGRKLLVVSRVEFVVNVRESPWSSFLRSFWAVDLHSSRAYSCTKVACPRSLFVCLENVNFGQAV